MISVCAREVETNGTHAQACQHDRGVAVALESVESVVAALRFHGAVDAAELVAFVRQPRADDVEVASPLAEDDGLFLLRFGGGEDVHHRFEIAAGCAQVHCIAGRFVAVIFGGIGETGFILGLGAAHGAFVMSLDDLRDALVAEEVAAGGYDGVVQAFQDDKIILRLDVSLQEAL